MNRFIAVLLTLLVVLGLIAGSGGQSSVQARPAVADAYVLIQKVNELRVSNGLAPYAINPILMQIAQAHSEYQAAIGQTTHYSADGSRPFQRALAAGYPVAGDLSLGGWFSENTWAGLNLSEDQAITNWLGDPPHTNTMLSPNLTEVGAGVAFAGSVVYYTLDAGRPAASMPAVIPTVAGATAGSGPTAVLNLTLTPVVVSTPREDGTLVHEVQPGETLWAIALAYGVTVDQILSLNGLQTGAVIYPGNLLVVRRANTATPVTPTITPTRAPTQTQIPTATASNTPLPPTSTLPSRTGAAPQASLLILGAIVVVALLAAGLITWAGARKRPD